MKIKAVLFDLDGTLLPLDQDVFVKVYFGGLAKKLAPYGYDGKALTSAIYNGIKEIGINKTDKTNEEVFWDSFALILGERVRDDAKYFDEYYQNDFDDVKVSCTLNVRVREVVDEIRQMGLRVAVATNPLFPAIATQKRIKWAGLKPEDFEFITTYENSKRCKPSLEYYLDVLSKLGLQAEECLMVGNDVDEDMVVTNLGMKVFLLTDNLINRGSKDLSTYPQGSLDQLLEFVKNINKD